jgi:glucokinase
VTAKDIFDEYKNNDKFAELVANQFAQYLGLATANIANMLNPKYIIIGGGVSAAGECLLALVKKEFDKHAFPAVKPITEIRLATLGNDAGLIGAAALVK